MTARWRKVASLPASHWRLLAAALPVVALVRLALWLLPFRTVARTVDRLSRPRTTSPDADADAESVALAVHRAGRCIPAATCLTRALAGKLLLGRHGLRSTVRIGVKRRPGGAIAAHAWLEHDGAILLGGHAPEMEGIQPLPIAPPTSAVRPIIRRPDSPASSEHRAAS